MEFNYDKFKDLVHYICHMADRDKLGATKLNKILWYADIISYLNRRGSITGSAYQKEEYGPVSKYLLRAIDDLSESGQMVVRNVSYHGKQKKEFISLSEPVISRFNPSEISLVDSIIHEICHHYTAKSISMKTHDIIWKLADIGEEIPYYAVYAAEFGEITQADIQWAKESIDKNEIAS